MAQTAVRVLNRIAGASAFFTASSWLLYESLYTVEGGHRAVIYHRFAGGVQDGTIGEGSHLRIPLVTYPTIFDVRLKPRVVASRTGTKDLQQVQISLRVLSRPNVDKLPEIYRTLGEDFDERVLPSIVNEVLKATVAQFDADQLLTQRDKVSKQIREALQDRAVEFGLILEDVSITHLVFSREFTAAIEAKQVAQQEAERSKFIVQMTEQEKLAAIIRAEGEAEAAELISSALRGAGSAMIEVKRIDAAKEVAEVLSGSRNVTYVPSSGGAGGLLLNLPAARPPPPPPSPLSSQQPQLA